MRPKGTRNWGEDIEDIRGKQANLSNLCMVAQYRGLGSSPRFTPNKTNQNI